MIKEGMEEVDEGAAAPQKKSGRMPRRQPGAGSEELLQARSSKFICRAQGLGDRGMGTYRPNPVMLPNFGNFYYQNAVILSSFCQ